MKSGESTTQQQGVAALSEAGERAFDEIEAYVRNALLNDARFDVRRARRDSITVSRTSDPQKTHLRIEPNYGLGVIGASFHNLDPVSSRGEYTEVRITEASELPARLPSLLEMLKKLQISD